LVQQLGLRPAAHVLTVLVHALALVEIQDRVVLQLPLVLRARRSSVVLAVLMVVTVLLLTVLHAVEASAWTGAYVALGARPDVVSATLYSLSAMRPMDTLTSSWRSTGS
jgi:hypothetical protein